MAMRNPQRDKFFLAELYKLSKGVDGPFAIVKNRALVTWAERKGYIERLQKPRRGAPVRVRLTPKVLKAFEAHGMLPARRTFAERVVAWFKALWS